MNMEKNHPVATKYAVCLRESGKEFFVTFNEKDETRALALASCISDGDVLVIITSDGGVHFLD